MSVMRINIDKVTNTIKVFNNGRGIPVVMHKEEKMMVPTMIFGHLLTSSNYNDDEKKVTGGRNGYGAKLCNIFSKKFVLETSTKETKKSFKQVSVREKKTYILITYIAWNIRPFRSKYTCHFRDNFLICI